MSVFPRRQEMNRQTDNRGTPREFQNKTCGQAVCEATRRTRSATKMPLFGRGCDEQEEEEAPRRVCLRP